MARLVLLQGGEAIPYELSDTEVTLGRHPDCVIQLESNMVSRFHAKVLLDSQNQYVIEDLGSGNGSFVNGKRIDGPTVLMPNDRLKFGPLLMRYETDDSVVATTAQSGSDVATIGDSADGRTTVDSPAEFNIDFTSAEEDLSTIMGSTNAGTGFGLLEVRPEAKLKAVIDITRSLAGTVDLRKLLPRILDTLFDVFPHADRGMILLKDPKSDKMLPAAQKHRNPGEDETVKLSRTILNKVLTDKTGILSADAATDSRFESSESISSLTIRSMMCVPMLDLDGNPTGVINIDTQNALNRFKDEDLDLLMAVAGQAALCYESARLLVIFMEKQKQDSEMSIAQNVQHALLPEILPQPKGYEFFASYDSAQAVGGDYYDSFMLGDDKVCISFGDVAGKGVPGALIMSRMSSVVQNTMQFTHDVHEAIAAINKHMCHTMVEGRFVTYILIVLDLKTNLMTLVNAGHMSPLIRRPDGRVDEFNEESIGIPVGIMDEFHYDVETRTLEPGETVVLITDGVDEAMNPQGELYTKERVKDFITAGSPKADELGKALLADVRKHANGRPQNDDITIMTFGRNPV